MAEPKNTGSYYSPGGLRLWGSATLGVLLMGGNESETSMIYDFFFLGKINKSVLLLLHHLFTLLKLNFFFLT